MIASAVAVHAAAVAAAVHRQHHAEEHDPWPVAEEIDHDALPTEVRDVGTLIRIPRRVENRWWMCRTVAAMVIAVAVDMVGLVIAACFLF